MDGDGFGVLRNRFYFPHFRDLPNEFKMAADYYVTHEGVWVPRRTWCLLAEIIFEKFSGRDDVVIVKDLGGNRFPVCLRKKPSLGADQWSTLRKGSTVCVRFAEQHGFTFQGKTRYGLEPGNFEFVKIIPVRLNDLVKMSDQKFEKLGKDVCWSCLKIAKQQRCSLCHTAHYCDAKCQVGDFENHDKICRFLKDYMDLVGVDFKEIVAFDSAFKAFWKHF